jgi:MATE family multidrug resistance protein
MQSPLAFWIMSAAALALTALLFGALLRWTMRQRAR